MQTWLSFYLRLTIHDLPFEGLCQRVPSKDNAKKAASEGTIRIQYYRSFIATPKTHKTIVRSLGFTKLNQIVERPNNASMRGSWRKCPICYELLNNGRCS